MSFPCVRHAEGSSLTTLVTSRLWTKHSFEAAFHRWSWLLLVVFLVGEENSERFLFGVSAGRWVLVKMVKTENGENDESRRRRRRVGEKKWEKGESCSASRWDCQDRGKRCSSRFFSGTSWERRWKVLPSTRESWIKESGKADSPTTLVNSSLSKTLHPQRYCKHRFMSWFCYQHNFKSNFLPFYRRFMVTGKVIFSSSHLDC